MSHEVNTQLLERAAEVKSEFEGTYLELAINKAIADNDLERLDYLVVEAEAELSRQEFNRYDKCNMVWDTTQSVLRDNR